MNTVCPVCLNLAEPGRDRDYGDKKQIRCPRCGPFYISGSAIAVIQNRKPDKVTRARVSHGIRSTTTDNNLYLLTAAELERCSGQALPSVGKQLENLVSWLAEKLRDDSFGGIQINPEYLAATVGAVDGEGVKGLIEYGVAQGVLRADDSAIGLSPEGWSPRRGVLVPNPSNGQQAMKDVEWDTFISHASEDKDQIVRPLARRLQDHGLKVWLDEFALTVGDSLRQSIDKGLSRSRFGIVVISPHFLEKHWPQAELNGLVARESAGQKVVLPVWHNITADEIRRWSPMLSDRLAVTSAKGLDHVVDELLKAIRRDQPEQADGKGIEVAAATRPPRALMEFSRKHHEARVADIVGGHAPVELLRSDLLVMHVVPSESLDGAPVQSFDEIAASPNGFLPVKANRTPPSRIDYAGLLVGSNVEGLAKPQRSYVQVSRNAIVELCATSLSHGQKGEFLELPYVQAIIIKYAFEYMTSLASFGVRAPYVVSVSLAGVKGVRFVQDFITNRIPEDLPYTALPGNNLQFGSVGFQSSPGNYIECAKGLEPILTHLANAAGLATSPYFDKGGNYTCNLN